ncbi:MAG: RNA 2',3'-cyclic phosphodiesterase [Candidatus Uhrbacteria bacterium]
MKRLFLAIKLSPEVKGVLYGLQDEFKDLMKHSKVTWVDPEIAHITLHFLGDVLEDDIHALVSELRAGNYPEPFELETRSTSCFPNPKKPKTLYVETSNHTAAIGLHKRLAKILVENGFEIDERPWTPHITLGRVRVQSETCPPDGIEVPRVVFEVSSFDLVESELNADGPIYTTIKTFKL